MARAILLLCLLPGADDAKFRVEGPPFVALDGSGDYEIVTTLEDAVPVWRIADAPGGILASVETKPKFSGQDFTIRGVKKITLKSTGTTEGDLRLAISLERTGERIAREEVVIRVGRVMEIPVQFRIVQHPRGGPEKTERFTSDAERKKIQDAVNAVWKQCGLRFVFKAGKPVKGEDSWFDDKSRFSPIMMKDGKRAKTPALEALFRHDDPEAVDVFVVRDIHWTEKGKGLGDATVDHSLMGVALKEESVIIDDSAVAETIAHELGHVFGLDDLGTGARAKEDVPVGERRRLMCSVSRFREGAAFTYDEMKTARKIAAKAPKSRGRR